MKKTYWVSADYLATIDRVDRQTSRGQNKYDSYRFNAKRTRNTVFYDGKKNNA